MFLKNGEYHWMKCWVFQAKYLEAGSLDWMWVLSISIRSSISSWSHISSPLRGALQGPTGGQGRVRILYAVQGHLVRPYLPEKGMGLLLLFSCSFMSDCNPVDCSTPGFPVPHHLLESAQVHVHCIGDAVQPSYPLTPSSPSAVSLSQHQGLFQTVICLHQMTKILELQLQHQSFRWNTQSWSPLRLTGLISLLSKGLLWVFSSTTVWRHQFFGVLPSLQSSTHTVCDHWEDHSLNYTGLCWQSTVSAFQATV